MRKNTPKETSKTDACGEARVKAGTPAKPRPGPNPKRLSSVLYDLELARLVCSTNVYCPQSDHPSPGYFVGNSDTLLQRLWFDVRRYTRVVYEYCFASVGWLDKAVAILTVELTLDDPHSLAECQIALLVLAWQERSIGERVEASIS